jgi:hypothetical protein
VPLTDEQIDAEFEVFASKFDHESNEWLDMGVDEYFRAGFRAAPPAAQPAPVQEPVGYITQARCFVHLHECTEAEAKLYGWKTIYTTPPAKEFTCSTGLCHYKAQRQWVGLTDAEVDESYDSVMFNPDIEPTRVLIYQAIEAKLKEKNT